MIIGPEHRESLRGLLEQIRGCQSPIEAAEITFNMKAISSLDLRIPGVDQVPSAVVGGPSHLSAHPLPVGRFCYGAFSAINFSVSVDCAKLLNTNRVWVDGRGMDCEKRTSYLLLSSRPGFPMSSLSVLTPFKAFRKSLSLVAILTFRRPQKPSLSFRILPCWLR